MFVEVLNALNPYLRKLSKNLKTVCNCGKDELSIVIGTIKFSVMVASRCQFWPTPSTTIPHICRKNEVFKIADNIIE